MCSEYCGAFVLQFSHWRSKNTEHLGLGPSATIIVKSNWNTTDSSYDRSNISPSLVSDPSDSEEL